MNPAIPIALAMGLYVWSSFNYWYGEKRIGMTLCFLGYALANIGLIIDAYEMKD